MCVYIHIYVCECVCVCVYIHTNTHTIRQHTCRTVGVNIKHSHVFAASELER